MVALVLKTVMKERLRLIDTLRGLTILSMIAFHACWDMVYFGFGVSAEFMNGKAAYIWQQSICWSFIFIAGFCFSYSRKPVKRGLMALGGGIIITLVTVFLVPDAADIFGVLILIGSSILIAVPVDRYLSKSKASHIIGLIVSVLLFILLRNVNRGTFGFESLSFGQVPDALYNGYFMTYLGFKDPDFFSTDYFSIIPWIFLFFAGFFTNKLMKGRERDLPAFKKGIPVFEFIGRHSLLIYMLHQVVLFGVFFLVSKII